MINSAAHLFCRDKSDDTVKKMSPRVCHACEVPGATLKGGTAGLPSAELTVQTALTK